MKKFFVILILIFVIFNPEVSFGADINSLEREAFILRVELNRLGTNGDPFEREAILQEIIDISKGTEEAVNAYWDLADLYLDSFPEEMRQEAREMLELCLKNYPSSKKVSMIKCKLLDLYDANDKRRAELAQQIQNDKNLPAMLRNSVK